MTKFSTKFSFAKAEVDVELQKKAETLALRAAGTLIEFIKLFEEGVGQVCRNVPNGWTSIAERDNREISRVFRDVSKVFYECMVGKGKLSESTYRKWYQAARYKMLHNIPVEIAYDATKEQIKRVLKAADVDADGTDEEKINRAWTQVQKEDAEFAKKVSERRKSGSTSLLPVVHPLKASDYLSPEEFWEAFAKQQVEAMRAYGEAQIGTLLLGGTYTEICKSFMFAVEGTNKVKIRRAQ